MNDLADIFLDQVLNSCTPSCSVEGHMGSANDLINWQQSIKDEIKKKLCIDDIIRNSCIIEISHEEKKAGFYLRKYIVSAKENFVFPCFVLIPDKPVDSVAIALSGHGLGASDIVGLEAEPSYQKAFARKLCDKGMITIVPELLGFGEMRLKDIQDSADRTSNSCLRLSSGLLSAGRTLLGMRVLEVQALIDIFKNDFSVSKIGIMGISGGGTVASFTTAIDDRIDACVISGYANCFKTSILAMRHCICNYLPGMLKSFDIPDILSSIAPRPMLWESGVNDPIYPVKGTRIAEKIVRKCYNLLGVDNLFECDYFQGGHEVSGRMAFDFLKKYLS